jgi:hypothetical protein
VLKRQQTYEAVAYGTAEGMLQQQHFQADPHFLLLGLTLRL